MILDVIQPKNHATQQDFFKCEAGTIGKNHYFFPFQDHFQTECVKNFYFDLLVYQLRYLGPSQIIALALICLELVE